MKYLPNNEDTAMGHMNIVLQGIYSTAKVKTPINVDIVCHISSTVV